jgi:hypothetical protein
VSAFIDWYRRLWADSGGDTDAELAAAEARLAVRLPPLLRDVYLKTSLRRSQMLHLRPIAEVEVRNGVLVFGLEQQGCLEWGIAVTGGTADSDRVLVELEKEWKEEGCSLDEFLRFFILTNRPYEPPSCEVDIDPSRLVVPWQLVRVDWLNIGHELWTDGEAVFEEASGRLGARDRDALVRAAACLGADPDDVGEDH